MKSFITGSHAYGTPHEKSDIDLVCLINERDRDILVNQSLNIMDQSDNSFISERDVDACEYPECCVSIRFGKLNLLCCVTVETYTEWLIGTEKLKTEKPVTREYACKVFKDIRDKNKNRFIGSVGSFINQNYTVVGEISLPPHES